MILPRVTYPRQRDASDIKDSTRDGGVPRMSQHRDAKPAGPDRHSDLLDPDSSVQWLESDLAAICRHQLTTAVQTDLAGLDPTVAPKLPGICVARGLLLRSFGDLLTHPNPPLELLQMTRRFAKAHQAHPASPLPPQIAGLFYYASIVAARLRCQVRISKLDDAELCRGLRACLAYTWLEDPLRSLLQEGLTFLERIEGKPA
jgi:hypothetical protein